MRFVLERLTDPDIEPVTVADFVRNVGEFQAAATERQADIEMAIAAAREWVEKETSRVLIEQQWRLTITDAINGYDSVQAPPPCGYASGAFSSRCGEIFLRRSPVIAIVSFVSVDSVGDETEVDPATYELRDESSKWPRIVTLNGSSWNAGTYRIVFRAGYADRDSSPQQEATVVPARLRQAVQLYAEALYDRDRMDELEGAASRLIASENCNTGIA